MSEFSALNDIQNKAKSLCKSPLLGSSLTEIKHTYVKYICKYDSVSMIFCQTFLVTDIYIYFTVDAIYLVDSLLLPVVHYR